MNVRVVRRAAGTAMACILASGLAGCSPSTSPVVPDSPTSPTSAPAVRPSPPPGAVTKLLVFVVENHSLDQMRSGMPYAFALAGRFGYATSYRAITHPSLPNYIGIAGGQTYGITDSGGPSANPVAGSSVFGQAVTSGKTAAIYAEGMTGSCSTSDGDSGYAVRHNPWPYFIKERSLCERYDLPVSRLGEAVTQGALPNVGMVIPNLCNDAHDCPLRVADAWFKDWMTKIFSGPDWESGHLAVVLTADEDDRSQGNGVLTAVIHPSQTANVVTSPLTHYSLTRLFEDVADTPYLSNAAAAPSMTTAFRLPILGR